MENDSENSSPASSEKKKQGKGDFVRFLGVASTVGINMVATTVIGFAIGYWVVDKYLGTFPWFTGIFLLLGIITGFKHLFKIARKMGEKTNDE
ncbi:MAG: AtpZ/AtpI family protein [Nitrospirota bacterium]